MVVVYKFIMSLHSIPRFYHSFPCGGLHKKEAAEEKLLDELPLFFLKQVIHDLGDNRSGEGFATEQSQSRNMNMYLSPANSVNAGVGEIRIGNYTCFFAQIGVHADVLSQLQSNNKSVQVFVR